MAEKETRQRRRPFQSLIPDETLEHARAARAEAWKGFESLLPAEFVTHQRAARKEALLAVRSLLDAALERIEKRESAA